MFQKLQSSKEVIFHLCVSDYFGNFTLSTGITRSNPRRKTLPMITVFPHYLNAIEPQTTKYNILQALPTKIVKEILVKCQLYFKLPNKLSFPEVTKTAEHTFFSYAVTILQCKMIHQTVNGQYKAVVNNSVLGLPLNAQQKVTFYYSLHIFPVKFTHKRNQSHLIYYNELSLQIFLKYQAA